MLRLRGRQQVEECLRDGATNTLLLSLKCVTNIRVTPTKCTRYYVLDKMADMQEWK